MKAWIITLICVVVSLLLMSTTVEAEFIYDVNGVFAPTLKNDTSASFVGTFTLPNESVDNILASIDLTNEEVPREVNFNMALNLPGNEFQPWDFRTYVGTFNEEPVTMFLVDYDMTAIDSSILDEWDGWAISFTDYPIGSVTSIQEVNEPGALGLLCIGLVWLGHFMRRK